MKLLDSRLPPRPHMVVFGTSMRMLSDDHLQRLHAEVNRIRTTGSKVPEPVRLMREMCHLAEIRRVY